MRTPQLPVFSRATDTSLNAADVDAGGVRSSDSSGTRGGVSSDNGVGVRGGIRSGVSSGASGSGLASGVARGANRTSGSAQLQHGRGMPVADDGWNDEHSGPAVQFKPQKKHKFSPGAKDCAEVNTEASRTSKW